jgi:osmotically-inducible protein OsmY
MLKALFFFVLGALVGGYAVSMHLGRQVETGGTQAPAEQTTADRIREWRLSAEEIREDLRVKGEIIRRRAGSASETFANARVIAVIKAKYVLDRDLSVFDISVSATDGAVVLTGSVASEELLGKAIALALDTDGVTDVTSRVTVRQATPQADE